MIEKDEMTLVKRASKGDETAFEALVARYEKTVYNLAFRMVPDREDAMDIAQEVFLKVYQGLSGFKGDSRFSTWIYRIGVNASLDFLRKRQKMRTYSLDEPLDLGESQVTREIGGEVRVEDVVEDLSLSQKAFGYIQQLDPSYRSVIVLCDIQGHTYKEIAGILGISMGTVKSRLHRARHMVKTMMLGEHQEHFEGESVKNDERGNTR